MADPTPSPAPQATGIPISIAAQYIKDLSFESPSAPQIFTPIQSAPEISMGVNVQTRMLTGGGHEVALSLKIESKLDGKAAFIAELVYCGVFTFPEMPEEQVRFFLLVEAPRLLFPFARSILTNAIRDGGFPHIVINPIDFMGLYLANKDNVGTMPTVGAA